MYLKIVNKGEIELEALFLLGASTKEGDNSKIGFFGSGNKYAIATLLRKDIKFKIYSGKKEVKITQQKVNFRGDEFNQIVLNGQPTSFTTRMGPTWETWFALREFVCNAIDEGGHSLSTVERTGGTEDNTTIYVEMASQEVLDFWNNLSDYILLIIDAPALPYTGSGTTHILPAKANNMLVYRRGVRCNQVKMKGLFSYNSDVLRINESRVFDSEYQLKDIVAEALLVTEDQEIVAKLIKHINQSDLFEANLNWHSASVDASLAWKEVLKDVTIYKKSHAEIVPHEDLIGNVVLPDYLYNILKRSHKTLRFYDQPDNSMIKATPSDQQATLIDMAAKEVAAFGYPIHACNLSVVKFAERSTIAMWINEGNRICLSIDHLSDYDELVSTLIEEVSHSQGYMDGTRKFEQYLMRELVKAKRDSVKLAKVESALHPQKGFETDVPF